MYLYN